MKKLFTAGQITFAALIGSPSLAGFLFALNEMRLGRRERGTWVAGASVAFTVAWMTAWFTLDPPHWVYWTLHLALVVAVAYAVPRYQPEVEARLLEEGFRVRGNGSVFLLWLVECVVVVSIVFPVIKHRSDNAFPSVVVADQRIFYQSPATAADAERLGKFFEDNIKGGVRAFRMKVERSTPGWKLLLLHAPGRSARDYQVLGEWTSREVFGGDAVELVLCNRLDFRDCRALSE